MIDVQLIDRIKNSWEKPSGLILVLILFYTLYFAIPELVNFDSSINLELYKIWIPVILTIAIFLFWLINTYRLPGFKKKEITIGIFLKLDEEKDKYENRFRDLVRDLIKGINDENKEVELRLYPINYFKSEKKLVQYIQSMNYSLDTAIYAEVSGGNYLRKDGNSDFKLVIEKINFTGIFNAYENLRVFKDNISISKEVQLRNSGKDWSIVENNSGIDRPKFKNNFRDLILHYAGIYLIYLNNLDAALSILKKLRKEIPIESESNYYSKKEIAIQGRINTNLLNLLMLRASRAYILENNKEKSRKILQECENLFGNHPESFSQFIALARNSYELDRIQEAKRYNEKAALIKPMAQEIFINRGFFGIIEKDYKKIYSNFYELGHLYRFKNNQSYLDIIAFLDLEKNKFKEENLTFDFAIGFYYYFYVDKNEGRKLLSKFIKNSKTNPKLSNLAELAQRFITKGEFKSVYAKRKSKNRKKRKRKKR